MEQNRIMKLLRIAALLTALICLAAGLACAEPAETIQQASLMVPDDSGPEISSGDAAAQYIYKTMNWSEKYKAPTPKYRGSAAGERLEGKQAWLYQALKEAVADVAAGRRESTLFEFPLAQIFDNVAYTAEDLGVSDLSSDEAGQAFVGKLFESISGAMDALLYDCPYELYWYDKTVGHGLSVSRSIQSDGTTCLAGYDTGYARISYSVAAAYSVSGEDRTCSFDMAKGQAVQSAAAAAGQIVTQNAGKNDYYKLLAYKNAICGLTDYNHEALADGTPYGDPWQLVYVFDGDPATTVVCEGYSKAFQYLCDLSTFSNASVISVSGIMQGGTGAGGHMWNIATLNGINYLADITNSDEGTVGSGGGLFLAGYSDTQNQNGKTWYLYRINEQNQVYYTYNDDTLSVFGGETGGVLAVSGDSYPVTACEHGTTETICTWTDESALEYINDGESETHLVSGMANQTCFCADCGEQIGDTETVAHSEREPHEYEAGSCVKCGYECLHSFENGQCTICGTECSHPHLHDHDVWENKTIEPLDDRYHTVRGTLRIEMVCAVCGQVTNPGENELVEFVYDHTYVNQPVSEGEQPVCAECGHVNTCPHESSYSSYQWTEEPVYTELEGDNRSHEVIGPAWSFDLCDHCGMRLNMVLDENHTETQPHSYSDGICSQCGHVNTCAHEHVEVTCGLWDESTAECAPKAGDNYNHTLTGDGWVYEGCADCGISVTYSEHTTVTVDFAHTYDENHQCTVCGYICTHDFNEYGSCRACYYQCPHESFENGVCVNCGYVCRHLSCSSREVWGEDKVVESMNDNSHTIRGTRRSDMICDICGLVTEPGMDEWVEWVYNHTYVDQPATAGEQPVCAECGHVNTCTHESSQPSYQWTGEPIYMELEGNNRSHEANGSAYRFDFCYNCYMRLNMVFEENYTETQPHSYSDGVCSQCGHVNTCTHEHTEVNTGLRDESTAECAPKDADNYYHTATGYGWVNETCEDCGLSSYTEQVVSVDCAHAYDENHQCTACGYVCTHDFDGDGYCPACGYQCPHESFENGVCVTCGYACPHNDEPLDDRCHTVRGTYRVDMVCNYCGMVTVPGEDELKEVLYDHTYVNQPVSEGEQPVCAECGHVNTCPHESSYSSYQWIEEPVYTELEGDNRSHEVSGSVYLYDICETCGMLLNTVLDENFTETQPHSYSDGVCTQCGHANTCTHEHKSGRQL